MNEITDYSVPERLQQRSMVVRYVTRDGKKGFQGGCHLKASQSYPAPSMDCIRSWFLICLRDILGHTVYNCQCFWEFPNGIPSEISFGPHCSPRFGRALSKVRTKHQKRNYRLAVEFLRSAQKSANEFDSRPRINNMWSKHCQLQPLMDFLATKR